MGRIGVKAIIYFEFATTVALFLGLGMVNLVRPGDGLHLTPSATELNVPKTQMDFAQILEHAFPTSILDSMARNDVLQLVVFCFLFGAACAAVGAKSAPVVSFCEGLAEVMFTYTRYVMYLAPFGVGAAIAVTVGSKGLGVLVNLGKLVGTMYVSLIIFVIVVLGGIMVLCKIPIKRWISAVREPWLLAFSTASSEAALPLAMQNMEKFGAPKHIVAFVIPTGYSFNLRRLDNVPGAGIRLRSASGRNSHALRGAVNDDADANANQQRSSRGAKGVAGNFSRNADIVPSPPGRRGRNSRSRRNPRHGQNLSERPGKLPGLRSSSQMGRLHIRGRRNFANLAPLRALITSARNDRKHDSNAIVDAAYRIHKELGPGLLESVYEIILAAELKKRGFEVLRQHPVPIA